MKAVKRRTFLWCRLKVIFTFGVFHCCNCCHLFENCAVISCYFSIFVQNEIWGLNNHCDLASKAPVQLSCASTLTINTLSCYRRCERKSLQIKILPRKRAKGRTRRWMSVVMCDEIWQSFKRKITLSRKSLLKVCVGATISCFHLFKTRFCCVNASNTNLVNCTQMFKFRKFLACERSAGLGRVKTNVKLRWLLFMLWILVWFSWRCETALEKIVGKEICQMNGWDTCT